MKIIIILFLFVNIAFAQSADNSGLSFLKNGADAQSVSMSDLGIVSENIIAGFSYNPALLSNLEHAQVFVSHHSSIQDLTSQIISAVFNFWDIPFGLSVNTTGIKNIEVRYSPGEAVSSFNANYFYAMLSSGFNLYNNLSAGISVKYIYEGLYTHNSTGLAFDFGLKYNDLFENLDFGASFRNIGSMNNLNLEATELPKDLRIGFGYNYPINNVIENIYLIAGFQKYIDYDDNHFHTGIELSHEYIAVRLGYVSGYESKALSGGLGLSWGNFNLDYSFNNYDFELGNRHIISVGYSFIN